MDDIENEFKDLDDIFKEVDSVLDRSLDDLWLLLN
jgi:hypothetical protein